MGGAQELADEHVAAFNAAVAGGDFTTFLARFDDDAVMRFENVPGAGVLEFAGRATFTAAYEQQPPDDQIGVTGPVRDEGGSIAVPFVWVREGGAGTMTLTIREGRIGRMVVAFA